MKRLLCLLLMLTLLCGCGVNGETMPPTTVPTETTLPLETTEPVPAILQNAAVWAGSEDLLEIELPFDTEEQGSSLSFAMLGENLLLWQTVYNAEGFIGALQFWLVDVQTGALLADYSQEFADWGEIVQIQSDRLCVFDRNQGTLTTLDRELEILAELDIGNDWNQSFLGSGNRLYTVMEDHLLERDLDTGAERRILEDVSGLWQGSLTPEGVMLNYCLAETGQWKASFFRFETGALEEPPFRGTFSDATVYGDVWLCHRASDYSSLRTGNGQQAWDLTQSGGAIYLLNDGNLLYTNGKALWLHAIDGQRLAECTLNDGQLYSGTTAPMWVDRLAGYLLEIYDQEENRSLLLFWEPQPEPGEALPAEEVDLAMTVEQELALLSARASELGAQYGIEILIGTDCQTDFADHTTRYQTDPDVIRMELDRLERILASFPEGFIPQLPHEEYQRIQIHLIRELKAKPHYGTGGDYDGVVYTSLEFGGYQMAIDTDSTDDMVYYHEFSHIIEDFVAWKCGMIEEMYFHSGWESLNPEGFSYTYDKSQYIDLVQEYFTYFVDNYALINANEDRSRVFEYACTSAGEWIFADKPGVKEKARFYAEAIRMAFDTTGWPEVTLWEQYLK